MVEFLQSMVVIFLLLPYGACAAIAVVGFPLLIALEIGRDDSDI
jgi:hypothetical protein